MTKPKAEDYHQSIFSKADNKTKTLLRKSSISHCVMKMKTW